MIKKAAINIKRMNPEISLQSLFLPGSRRYDPKTPLVTSEFRINFKRKRFLDKNSYKRFR